MSSMVWASNDVLYAGSVNYGIWRFAASGGVGEKLRPDTASFRATHLVLSDDEKVLVYGRVGSAADRRVRLSVIRLRDGKRAAIDINGAAAGAALLYIRGSVGQAFTHGQARGIGAAARTGAQLVARSTCPACAAMNDALVAGLAPRLTGIVFARCQHPTTSRGSPLGRSESRPAHRRLLL